MLFWPLLGRPWPLAELTRYIFSPAHRPRKTLLSSQGVLVSKLFSTLLGNKEVRVLILGLDNAGKTTILYKLQMGEVVTTVPTIGFNVETVQYKNLRFQVWDLGGQTSIRPCMRQHITEHTHTPLCSSAHATIFILTLFSLALPIIIMSDWRCYYQNTNAVIYVVDSNDPERMGISKQELMAMLEEEELKDAALIVFANKQDLPNSLPSDAIASELGLGSLKNRKLPPHSTHRSKQQMHSYS